MGDTMGALGSAFINLTKFENEQAILNTQRLRAADIKSVATASVKVCRLFREWSQIVRLFQFAISKPAIELSAILSLPYHRVQRAHHRHSTFALLPVAIFTVTQLALGEGARSRVLAPPESTVIVKKLAHQEETGNLKHHRWNKKEDESRKD
ncbi:Sorting nexin 2B [Olea europaea subsp. europaea]|uniref:Sorting nexin 2B n=1 Tax=Olea europaea subsp. europaea TaxID=158383 RepID=A0A8S0RBS1_OLEEU|nr:Sorting nexin 2B [Olea europaea subsp. europaea]